MIKLLIVFSIIASTTIGGGLAMIPLIQQEAIYINKWITETDFVNIMAISQVTPGAIAINSASFIGVKTFGIIGGIIAPIGFVLPSVVLILLIAPLLSKYEKNRIRINIFSGIRPVVTGLITVAVISMGKTTFLQNSGNTIASIIITIASFFIIRYAKVRPVFILLLCALCGLFL